ncbi:DUF2063 domain-containing protein [Caulobacter vibrioides]|uniref:Putative DNA-binding domain-containing protein n=2 Tax=Caulobacter vibrioides TaxID=155892 RepID=Q9A4D1_CAUVC|nr:DNA-binding domain-containing protein [Caulobacter vibrioides]YP_002518372.1 putative DNA-binding domain-containing protein [Caulobacter vibrioides NA1000]AAK24867.1 hypothetical protein CC_2905 [Caulobacter vibrioides CB15]ACL96464.1 putative DNA-binding domain-containing protein [Caulobacter vibrioides NA1000]ATC29736.1 DUF2063 domain-containing protein [Caulobacter vibrioides]AZH13946.1 DUF2063 domain-containing protein [Caulobacter vibrioides]QXZ51255.1 DNA-binding domain-containing pr
MSLLALQRGFRDQILAEQPGDLAVLGVQARGLSVYRHAYRAQLITCLRETYEKTWSWLGDEAFDAAAADYVAAYPPRAWTLSDYGEAFAAVLAQRYPSDPEVAELAWMDWALRRAFDGAGGDPVPPEVLASANWDSACLGLAPTLSVAEVVTNCAAIWTALNEDQAPPMAAMLPEPAAVRVWRTGLSPQYRTIDGVEAMALSRVLAGAPFAMLCAELAEQLGDAEEGARRAGALLGQWIQDGLVEAVHEPGEPPALIRYSA